VHAAEFCTGAGHRRAVRVLLPGRPSCTGEQGQDDDRHHREQDLASGGAPRFARLVAEDVT